jgi:hypothetical protein
MNIWRAGVVEVVASTPHKASSALAVPEGLRQVSFGPFGTNTLSKSCWKVQYYLPGAGRPRACAAKKGDIVRLRAHVRRSLVRHRLPVRYILFCTR